MARDITLERLLTEDIFSLVGLEGLEDEKKAALLSDMQRTVLAKVYADILESMDEEEKTVFESLPADQIEGHLERRGIGLAELISEESVRYRVQLALAMQNLLKPGANSALKQNA
jgi:hypothetical protein